MLMHQSIVKQNYMTLHYGSTVASSIRIKGPRGIQPVLIHILLLNALCAFEELCLSFTGPENNNHKITLVI